MMSKTVDILFGNYTISDRTELTWLCKNRPQKCNYLQYKGPEISLLLFDLDNWGPYYDIMEMTPTICKFVDHAINQPFLMAIACASGVDACASGVNDKRKNSYRLYVAGTNMDWQSRKALNTHLQKVIPHVDLEFVKQRSQHTRVLYCDKMNDETRRPKNRPLVPYALVDRHGALIKTPQCWQCFLDYTDIFARHPLITLTPSFQKQIALDRKEDFESQVSRRGVYLTEKLDKNDRRCISAVELVRPFLSPLVTKLEDAHFTLGQYRTMSGTISSKLSPCPYGDPRLNHNGEKKPRKIKGHHNSAPTTFRIFERPNGLGFNMTLTDWKCKSAYKPLWFKLDLDRVQALFSGGVAMKSRPPNQVNETKGFIPAPLDPVTLSEVKSNAALDQAARQLLHGRQNGRCVDLIILSNDRLKAARIMFRLFELVREIGGTTEQPPTKSKLTFSVNGNKVSWSSTVVLPPNGRIPLFLHDGTFRVPQGCMSEAIDVYW